jgi:uncharacterized protein involved in oxidation of intracellular sulfur
VSETDSPSTEKIVIFATHGPDDPERATFPFVMGNAALAMESQATIVLQGAGVSLAMKSCHEHVFAGGLPPLGELLHSFLEQGGKIWVCMPCIKERRITQDLLVEGAEITAAGKVVTEVLEADATLNY